MAAKKKSAFPQILDLPLLAGAALTVGFYLFVQHESMKGSLLQRYTTEHTVEYVIVAFFFWGLADAFFRVLTFPRESLALRHEWLPKRVGPEPITRAGVLLATIEKQPEWLRQSRIGQRLAQALAHLQEKGSADEFAEYLHHLSDQDHEKTTSNYGLLRFICWVTPMFGFLGTVVHFGTALSGQSAGEIGDKLPHVVAEMGTAFNTTTVALTAATTMMFCLFVCERIEQGIVLMIDQRTERELLNRFEVADAALTPFLAALHASGRATLESIDAGLQRQLEGWTGVLQSFQKHIEISQQRQAQIWTEALERIEQRFEANDAQREQRLARVLETFESQRGDHVERMSETTRQLTAARQDMSQLVSEWAAIARGQGELVGVQNTLAENLRLLHESQQIDQALHGLTAAIHLMTARNPTPPAKDKRAA